MRAAAIRRWEIIVAIAVTTVVIVLLIVKAAHAGPLWRDECGMAQLAKMRVIDVFENFQHQTSPPLFGLVVHFYVQLFGSGDAALRRFGFIVGLGMLAISWFNARVAARGGVPLLFLALIGLNSTFLISGTSIRGYGFGSALLLLALGLSVKALFDPTSRNLAALSAVAIASIYCLANNVPLVGSIALAAAIILFTKRRYRAVVITCGLTTIAALAFLPVAYQYLSSTWARVVQIPTDAGALFPKFLSSLGEPLVVTATIWSAAAVLALVAAMPKKEKERPAPNLRVCLALFCALSIFAYYEFLKLLGYPTRSWYYLPLICSLAGAMDLIVNLAARTAALRIARLALALVALLVMPFMLRAAAIQRASNMDLVVAELEKDASPNDLVVVNPWYLGVSFQWHYHGALRWMSSPPIAELRLHRYDQFKEAMQRTDPLADVRAAIEQTLRNGNRVWLVGGARPPEPDLPLSIQPAPDPEFGWSGQVYVNVWSMQLADFLQKHVREGTTALSPVENVNPDENVALLVARGWQD